MLGRVYKDRWEAAAKGRGSWRRAARKAIEAYLKGFESDWRDAYPGVNAVTLMELRDPPDPRASARCRLSATRSTRIAAGKPDYWDHATLLELAVLAADESSRPRAGAGAGGRAASPGSPRPPPAICASSVRPARRANGRCRGPRRPRRSWTVRRKKRSEPRFVRYRGSMRRIISLTARICLPFRPR